jgi:hypothetical protein
MQLGKWTTQGGAANNANQLHFKFGSVVGFTNIVAPNGTAWPGASAVKFNPVTGSPVYSDYTSIPNWNGSNTTDGYISSDSYHTKANVLTGRGDPCKLVGLTIKQIEAGAVDNGEYRLPTEAENGAYSSPTYVAGNGWVANTLPTAGIHTGTIGTSFLPAAGERNPADGTTWNVGLHGHYWSSRAVSSTAGDQLHFYSGHVYTSNFTANAHSGHPVRCVPQS